MAVDIKTGLLSPVEQKTTITSSKVGSATSGIIRPDRVADYVPGARRRSTILDVLPSRPVTSNAVEFTKESVFTNNASPQVEGSAKQESAISFTIGTATIRTIAHWIPVTNQVIEDWPTLRRVLNETLLYGLKLKEERQLLSGDGTGQNIEGLTTAATAYAGSYNTANDTNLDRLRWAILEAEDDDEIVDFIVLNPKNFYTILGLKTEDSGTANTGSYTVGDPLAAGSVLSGYTFWGKGVVVTNSMTGDYFLVGSSAVAQVFDRMEATIMLSREHDTFFTANKTAVLVVERIGMAVYRSSGLIYGAF